jgi:hypothetical protein
MIFRYFMHKKTVAQNNRICELNKEFLHLSKNVLSEEELIAVKELFELQERNFKEHEIRFGKLCDVIDILLYAMIAQVVLALTGFEIGSIVVQFIVIFAMAYAFFIVKNKSKYLYLVVIFFNLLSVSYDIWLLL